MSRVARCCLGGWALFTTTLLAMAAGLSLVFLVALIALLVTRQVVAPVRSLLQRLGPHVEDAAPVLVRKGEQIDAEARRAGSLRSRAGSDAAISRGTYPTSLPPIVMVTSSSEPSNASICGAALR